MTSTVKLEGGTGMGAHLPFLLSNDMYHADVKIVTADGYKLLAHSVS